MADNSGAQVIAYLKSLGVGELTIAKLERLARNRGISLEALLANDFRGWRSPPSQEEDDPSDNPIEGATDP